MRLPRWMKSYWAAVAVWCVVYLAFDLIALVVITHGDIFDFAMSQFSWGSAAYLAVLALVGGGLCRWAARHWAGTTGAMLSGLSGVLCMVLFDLSRHWGVYAESSRLNVAVIATDLFIGALAGMIIGVMNRET